MECKITNVPRSYQEIYSSSNNRLFACKNGYEFTPKSMN